MCHQIRSNIQNTESWLLAALTEEEQQCFRSLLIKIRDHLCEEQSH